MFPELEQVLKMKSFSPVNLAEIYNPIIRRGKIVWAVLNLIEARAPRQAGRGVSRWVRTGAALGGVYSADPSRDSVGPSPGHWRIPL